MIQTRARSALVSAAIVLAAALGASGQAQAAVYGGSWDPAYGAPFADLGWKGTATFFIPDACLLGSGLIQNTDVCSNGSMKVLGATVDFYNYTNDPTGSTVLETLIFDPLAPNVSVSRMQVTNGQLVGVDSSIFAPLLATNLIAGSGKYSFSLQFTSDHGAKLFYSEKTGDERRDTQDDDSDCNFSNFGGPNTEECGVNDFKNSPATMKYSLVVPEPGTYALVLAGLGAMGLVARRRRR